MNNIIQKYGFPRWDNTMSFNNSNGYQTHFIPLTDSNNNTVNGLLLAYQNGTNGYTFKIINKNDPQSKLPEHGNKEASIFTKQSLKGIFKTAEEKLLTQSNNSSLSTIDRNRVKALFWSVSYSCWYYTWTEGDGSFGISNTQCSYSFVFTPEVVRIIQFDEPIFGGWGGGGGSPNKTLEISMLHKFPMNSNYKKLYPKFYALVNSLYSRALKDPIILNALKSYGHFSKDSKGDLALYNMLQFGKGAEIIVQNENNSAYKDRYGHFDPTNPDEIFIDKSLVEEYEKTTNAVLDQTLSLFLFISVLHETVHYANNLNGFNEKRFEFGNGWETVVYGKYIDSPEMAGFYLLKKINKLTNEIFIINTTIPYWIAMLQQTKIGTVTIYSMDI